MELVVRRTWAALFVIVSALMCGGLAQSPVQLWDFEPCQAASNADVVACGARNGASSVAWDPDLQIGAVLRVRATATTTDATLEGSLFAVNATGAVVWTIASIPCATPYYVQQLVVAGSSIALVGCTTQLVTFDMVTGAQRSLQTLPSGLHSAVVAQPTSLNATTSSKNRAPVNLATPSGSAQGAFVVGEAVVMVVVDVATGLYGTVAFGAGVFSSPTFCGRRADGNPLPVLSIAAASSASTSYVQLCAPFQSFVVSSVELHVVPLAGSTVNAATVIAATGVSQVTAAAIPASGAVVLCWMVGSFQGNVSVSAFSHTTAQLLWSTNLKHYAYNLYPVTLMAIHQLPLANIVVVGLPSGGGLAAVSAVNGAFLWIQLGVLQAVASFNANVYAAQQGACITAVTATELYVVDASLGTLVSVVSLHGAMPNPAAQRNALNPTLDVANTRWYVQDPFPSRIARTPLDAAGTSLGPLEDAVAVILGCSMAVLNASSLEILWSTSQLCSQRSNSATAADSDTSSSSSSGGSGIFSIAFDTTISAPIVYTIPSSTPFAAPAVSDVALFIPLLSGVTAVSPTRGWTYGPSSPTSTSTPSSQVSLNVVSAVPIGSVVLVAGVPSANGKIASSESVVAAVDQRGMPQWTTSFGNRLQPTSTFVVAAGYRNGFAVVDDMSTIIVFDTYTGQSVGSIAIPTDCYSNMSSPRPSIAGLIAVDRASWMPINSGSAALTDVLFTAGLPCVLRIDPELRLQSLLVAGETLSDTPTADPLNRLIFVHTTHLLYAVPIDWEQSSSGQGKSFFVASFQHPIVEVIPLSPFVSQTAPSSSAWYYPYVMVRTTNGVELIDVAAASAAPSATTDADFNRNKLWSIAQRVLATELSGSNVNSKMIGGGLITLSNAGICRISITPPQSANDQQYIYPEWCRGQYQVVTGNVISNLAAAPNGNAYFMIDTNMFMVNGVNGMGALVPMSDPHMLTAASTGTGCTQLAFAGDIYVLLALCDGTLFALDVLQDTYPVLFSVPVVRDLRALHNGDVTIRMWYATPNLYIFSSELSSVSAYPVEVWTASRSASEVLPTPTPTTLAPALTLAPGLTPAPLTPSPYVPPYPPVSMSTAPMAPTTFDPYNGDQSSMSASAYLNFSDSADLHLANAIAVVFGPAFDQGTQKCVISAYDASSTHVDAGQRALLWKAPYTSTVNDGQCSCGTVSIDRVKPAVGHCLVSILCDGDVTTYDATSGTLAWNGTATSTGQSASQTACVSANGNLGSVKALAISGIPVIVGLTTQYVCGFHAVSGTLLFSGAHISGTPIPSALRTFDDGAGGFIVAFVGTAGLQAVHINASFTLTTTFAVRYLAAASASGHSAVLCSSSAILASNSNDYRLATQSHSGASPVGTSLYSACLASTPNAPQLVAQMVSWNPVSGRVNWVINLTSSTTPVPVSVINELILKEYGSPKLVLNAGLSGVIIVDVISHALGVLPMSSSQTSFVSTTGRFVVVVFRDQQQGPAVTVFDVTSGQQLWSTFVASMSLPASGPMASAPVPSTLLVDGTLVVACSGLTAFASLTGNLLWVSHPNAQGFARQIITAGGRIATGLGSSVEGFAANSLFGVLVTHVLTSTSVGYVVAVPPVVQVVQSAAAAAAGQPKTATAPSPCFRGENFALLPPSITAPVGGTASLVATAWLHETVPLITDFNTWNNQVDEVGPMFVLTSQQSTTYAVSILSKIITFVNVATGLQSAVVFRSEACPLASAMAESSLATQVSSITPDSAIVTDGACIYLLNASTLTVRTAPMVTPEPLALVQWIPGTNGIATHVVLASIVTGVVGVVRVPISDAEPLGLLWLNDDLMVLGYVSDDMYSSPQVIPLQNYPSGTQLAQQAIIVVTTLAVAAIRLSDGSLLWVNTWVSILRNVPTSSSRGLLSFQAAQSYDGTLIVFCESFLVSVPLNVGSGQPRTISWSVNWDAIVNGTQISGDWIWAAMVPFTSTVVGVTSWNQVVAFDTQTRTLLWMTDISTIVQQAIRGVFSTFRWVYAATGSGSPPVALMLSGIGSVALSLNDGKLLYQLDTNIALQRNSASTWVPTAIVEDVVVLSAGYTFDNCLSPWFMPTHNNTLPVVVSTSPPLVPLGYQRAAPLPRSHAVTPSTGPQAPLTVWDSPAGLRSSKGFFAVALSPPQPVFFMLRFNRSLWTNPSVSIDITSASSGATMSTINTGWITQCNARNLLWLNPSFAAAACLETAAYRATASYYLSVFDLSTVQLTRTIPTLLQLDALVAQPIPLPDQVSVGCFCSGVQLIGGAVLCFNLETGATLVNFTCPDLTQGYISEIPQYSTKSQVLTTVCETITNSGKRATSLAVVSLQNAAQASSPPPVLMYSVNDPDDVTIMDMHMLPDGETMGLLLQSSDGDGDLEVQLFNVTMGAGAGLLLNVTLLGTSDFLRYPIEAPYSMTNIHVVDIDTYFVTVASQRPVPCSNGTSGALCMSVAGFWIQHEPNPLQAAVAPAYVDRSIPFSSKATISVEVDFSSVWLLIATTTQNPGSQNQVTAQIVAKSLFSGTTAFNVSVPFPVGYYPLINNIFFILNGSYICAAFDEAIVLISTYTLVVTVAPVQIQPGNGVITAGVPQPTGSDVDVVDLMLLDGTILQLALLKYSTSPLVADQFRAVRSATAESMVASLGAATVYFLNASAATQWGTWVNPEGDGDAADASSTSLSQASDPPPNMVPAFDPLLIQSTTPPLMLTSVGDRTFNGYDANNGTLLFSGFLPLCEGRGSESGFVKGTADESSKSFFLVIGNTCVYRVSALDGSVVQSRVSSAPLQPQLLITPSCVLTQSTFGAVVCVDRVTLSVRWTSKVGFVSRGLTQVAGVTFHPIKEYRNLVLVLTETSLLCLMESSGTVVWEYPVGSAGASFCVAFDVVVVVTPTRVFALFADPNSRSMASRLFWSTSITPSGGNASIPTSSSGEDFVLLDPVVAVDGTVIVALPASATALYPQFLALSIDDGSIKYSTPVSSTGTLATAACTSLQIAGSEFTQSVLQNLFFATCGGSAQVRAVASGAPLVSLGFRFPTMASSVGTSCSGSDIAVLASADMIAFCNVNGMVEVQQLPQYVLNRAPQLVVKPSTAPTPYTLPPGYLPDGVATPAPTVSSNVSLPDVACMLNIEALFTPLQRCLSAVFVTAYSVGPSISRGGVNCTNAASVLQSCASQWMVGATCQGALIYLQSALSNVNKTDGSLPFCRSSSTASPTGWFCDDGDTGNAAFCAAINTATLASGGQTYPSDFVASLPAPFNQLPSFSPPIPQAQPSAATHGMSGGAAAGVAIGVIVAVAAVVGVLYHRRRRLSSGGRLGYHENMVSAATFGEADLSAAELRSVGTLQQEDASAARLLSIREPTKYTSL